MATLVKANVNLPGLTGAAKMNIMTGDPHNASTRLLGQIWLQDGQATSTFDAIEGQNSVFVTIEQDNEYKLYGLYNIVNGQLGIGNVVMPATRMTRAGGGISDDCPDNVTKGDLVSIDCIDIPTDEIIGYSYKAPGWTAPVNHTFAEWIALGKEALPTNNPTIYSNESLFRYKKDYVDFSHSVLKEPIPALDGEGNQIEYEGVKQWLSGPVVNDNGTITYYYNQQTSSTKSIEEWKAIYTINQDHTTIPDNANTNGPWELSSLSVYSVFCGSSEPDAYYFDVDPDVKNWQLRTDGTITDYYGTAHPQWQYIDNIETGSYSWNIGWGASLFGNGALFAESVEYWADSKVALYDESTIETMEKGLEIITTENQGPIDLPYIFGCTDYFNQFGYVYYTEGQDPLLQPHYVLIDDARPSKNMTYDGSATGNKDLGTLVQNAQNASNYTQYQSGLDNYLNLANKQVVGTTYRLMYFDEKTQKFTYQFPANVHIIFFIDDLGSESNQQNHTGYNAARFNYSLPELNERIGHTSPANGKDRPGGPAGLVKCITFSSNGINYVGFGDNSGDEDLNDIVFVVGAAPINKVETCPIIWHINENGTSGPEVETDIFSRETVIVGKTYNSPANTPSNGSKIFRGWSSTPDNSSQDLFQTLTDAPTTSTAAIHYYAIWDIDEEPTPDPEWQSWIFACEDLGGSFDYDFNDLVFAVKKTAIENSTNVNLELIPLAAGGTLSAHIYYGTSDKGEIHKLLTGTEDYTKQILSGQGDPVLLAESVDLSISINSVASEISIHVAQKDGNKSSTYTISHEDHNESYKTPEILILPEGWDWPNEGVIITDVYSKFANWNNDINDYAWIDPKNKGVVQGVHYIVNPLKGEDPFVPPVVGLGTEIASTLTTNPGDANGIVKVTRDALSAAVPSGAVNIYIQGTVTNPNYYHFTKIRYFINVPTWGGGDFWMDGPGSEATQGSDYVTWSLSSEEYEKLLNSKDDVELCWCNINDVKVYIKAAQ